jgi:hypothetical protein
VRQNLLAERTNGSYVQLNPRDAEMGRSVVQMRAKRRAAWAAKSKKFAKIRE